MNGIIFDLKRFAVHDGGGLRTTLFLKGCPLRCPWCQNPEGLEQKPILLPVISKCIGCKSCISACPQGALTWDNRIYTNPDRCRLCGRCAAVCPGDALELVGREISDREAADLLLRDKVFYENGGGVTLSGGEVLLQWQFAGEVLRICHEAGVHTAIETSLYTKPQVLESLLEVTDQFIVDIKLLDPSAHQRIIGVDNTPILDNYRLLAERGADILVRTPLIPGFTDSEDNIRTIARFLRETDPQANYELLNFNPLCRSKYDALGRPYPVSGSALPQEKIDRLYEIVAQAGLRKYKE